MSFDDPVEVPKTMDDLRTHMGLVYSIVRQHYRWALNSRIGMQDLIQEGFLGLVKAMEKFDPERGTKFSTCAHWWIRATVSRYVGANYTALSCPSGAITDSTYGNSARTKLAVILAKRAVSLQSPRRKRDGSCRGCLDLADLSRSHWDEVDGRDEASLLVRWCQENLTDRQFRILYGRCVNGSTLEDMAKGNGLEGQNLTRERVRQIEEKALEKIHRYYPGRDLCQA